MKKKLLGSVAATILLLVGCSKQPSLENAQETNTTKSVPQQKVEQPAKENVSKSEEGNASTLNEEVTTQEENLTTVVNANTETNESVAKVKVENSNEKFAKQLSQIVIYFDFDKYNIRTDQWPKVEKLAKLIKSNPSNYTVRIEGNCDEWGTEEYNYALGLKRANSVKNALIKLGVDPKKLTVISYGELNPVCTAHTRWCWRLNRRDNFTYLP
jgi:peptidoglycan-associated lipoprotein